MKQGYGSEKESFHKSQEAQTSAASGALDTAHRSRPRAECKVGALGSDHQATEGSGPTYYKLSGKGCGLSWELNPGALATLSL